MELFKATITSTVSAVVVRVSPPQPVAYVTSSPSACRLEWIHKWSSNYTTLKPVQYQVKKFRKPVSKILYIVIISH